MPQATQSLGSKLVWVVMAGLVLACVAMASALWKSSGSTAQANEAAQFTAADVQAAVVAAREHERAQLQQGMALVKPAAGPVNVSATRMPQANVADNPSSPPMQALHRLDAPAMPAPVASGRDGLAMLVNQGALRPASPSDLQRWLLRAREQQMGAINRDAAERMSRFPAYLITGPLRIPEGLGGADLVFFLMDSRSPYPMGSLGHSALLDMETGGCSGVACSMLLR
jgi:hypothetical protein